MFGGSIAGFEEGLIKSGVAAAVLQGRGRQANRTYTPCMHLLALRICKLTIITYQVLCSCSKDSFYRGLWIELVMSDRDQSSKQQTPIIRYLYAVRYQGVYWSADTSPQSIHLVPRVSSQAPKRTKNLLLVGFQRFPLRQCACLPFI